MSLMHDFIQFIIRTGHHPYDPTNPPDYPKRRIEEEKRFRKLPKDLTVTSIEEEDIHGESISKEGNDEKNIILYIHGGGFVSGSAKSRRDITFYLARHSGYNVISINYPLAPENLFPLAVETCFNSYSSLVKRYGAKHIAVMGESAGGNLVLSMLLMAKDHGVDLPASVSVFSPGTVLAKKLPSYSLNAKKDAMLDENIYLEIENTYLNSPSDADSIYASPLYGDFHGFPSVLLFASDSEVLMDDSVLLHQKMREQGVDITFDLGHNLMHAYAVIPFYKEAKKALSKTIEFMHSHFDIR